MLERLQSELKTAMLARDEARTRVLRMALSAYRNEAVARGLSPQGQLAEAEALAVFRKLVKSREESIEHYLKAGASDRAAAEQAEIEVLKGFLPAALEGADLEAAVRAAVEATGATGRKDLGRAMKHLQAAHPGAFDGKAASQILQTLLP